MKDVSFFDVIWYLEQAQEKIKRQQKRKNLTVERNCELTDEWIRLSLMIEFLREQL